MQQDANTSWWDATLILFFETVDLLFQFLANRILTKINHFLTKINHFQASMMT